MIEHLIEECQKRHWHLEAELEQLEFSYNRKKEELNEKIAAERRLRQLLLQQDAMPY